jgi:predicted amidohydrolase YtcJ
MRIAIVVCVLCALTVTVYAQGPADLVVRNAKVLTMNANQSVAQGFAVVDSRFSFVGTSSELEALVGPDTKVIDLGGKVVLPGLIDAHLHPVPQYPQGHRLHQVDLKSATTKDMASLIARLSKQAGVRPKGDWILGFGYEDTVLGGHPDRSNLDRVSTDHPVYIVHSSGHRAVANTLALELAGVTDAVRDPPGGGFARGPDGKLNGILLESASDPLRAAQQSKPSLEELMTGVEVTLSAFVEKGLTTVVDATPSSRSWLFPVYSALRDAGRLPIRVVAMLPLDLFGEVDPAHLKQDDWLSVGPVKVFHGNSLSGRTAWLSEHYLGRPDDFGIPPGRSQDELNEIVRSIDQSGMQAAIHSNGDREIDMVLTAFEKLAVKPSGKSPRHRIEHASVMTQPLLDRTKQAGLVLALHSYVYEHGDKMEDYGAARWDWMHANRTALEMGIPVAGNSDYPISAADPMLRLQSLVTRRARGGKLYGARQRLAVSDALATFTMGAAYSVFQETTKGSIEAGKFADFVVVDVDPTEAAPEDLADIEIVSTWIGGHETAIGQ